MLSWIDICAGLAAKTFSRGPCVTASVDAVHFLRPCHVSSQLARQPPVQAARQLCLCSCSANISLQRSHALPALQSYCHWRQLLPGRGASPPHCPRLPLPLQVGSVCVIAAMVNRTFRTSMEVGVRVEEEDSKTGARHHCCR